MKISNFKVYLAITWLILTSSLIIWWMYFALGLVAQLGVTATKHQNMLILEGATLLILLIAGGGTLIYLINKEKRRADTLRGFFAAFSHDMKTAVASLRLQTESLQQDLSGQAESLPILKRLIADTSRILVTTDNSLHIAHYGSQKLLKENVNIKSLLESMSESWPQLKIDITGNYDTYVDRRALQNVFENIIYNAVAHGNATEINVKITDDKNYVSINLSDNGKGFDGNTKLLGKAFFRHTVTSGSGLGLSIVKSIIQQLKGIGPEFQSGPSGFEVSFSLPRAQ